MNNELMSESSTDDCKLVNLVWLQLSELGAGNSLLEALPGVGGDGGQP